MILEPTTLTLQVLPEATLCPGQYGPCLLLLSVLSPPAILRPITNCHMTEHLSPAHPDDILPFVNFPQPPVPSTLRPREICWPLPFLAPPWEDKGHSGLPQTLCPQAPLCGTSTPSSPICISAGFCFATLLDTGPPEIGFLESSQEPKNMLNKRLENVSGTPTSTVQVSLGISLALWLWTSHSEPL